MTATARRKPKDLRLKSARRTLEKRIAHNKRLIGRGNSSRDAKLKTAIERAKQQIVDIDKRLEVINARKVEDREAA